MGDVECEEGIASSSCDNLLYRKPSYQVIVTVHSKIGHLLFQL